MRDFSNLEVNMQNRKLILLDLDGTIIDHDNNEIPKTTISTIKKLQKNGHIVVIATGRAPSLFYGVDKQLNINTIVAANGRYVEHDGKVLLHDSMDKELVARFTEDMVRLGIDVGFSSVEDYVVNNKSTDLPNMFSTNFHVPIPKINKDFYLNNDILQMVLFTTIDKVDYQRKAYPELEFNYSCQYGLDVNLKGGMKDIGLRVLSAHLNIPMEDTIAVGDGNNDISMIKAAHVGVAMGNARDELKDVADFVTDTCSNNGIEKIFKKLNLI
jgi:Cof subfamily protein (haloacid dehalogenase superfamily)